MTTWKLLPETATGNQNEQFNSGFPPILQKEGVGGGGNSTKTNKQHTYVW